MGRANPFATRRQASASCAVLFAGVSVLAGLCLSESQATPANRAALTRHYDRFLVKKLTQCTTCHLPGGKEDPTELKEFPHNPFGDRLRQAGLESTTTSGTKPTLEARLGIVAQLDSDGDGVANESEILLGHNPGDPQDTPLPSELASIKSRLEEFARFQSSYRWRPFETVQRPPVPEVRNRRWVRTPVDAFIAAGQEERGLSARPEARKEILLRRVYLDLLGLQPTPEEQSAFLADTSPDAYERVVDRLLNDPRHGERWGRHWMDVWRYSDWAGWSGGNQIRDSKPHIWRWRDWIVESLNADKGYDRMVMEMLAADELAPLDTEALRATGFLVRNYKMLSREQWMEDTIKHTAQAFLGITMGCAKCHDHMTDPISQFDYYRMRAIFDPHQVRTDRLPGELDTAKDGVVRVYDTAGNRQTPLFVRGDERHPDSNRLASAGVPVALCGMTSVAARGGRFDLEPVQLPFTANHPDWTESVRKDLVLASERAVREARAALAKAATNTSLSPEKLREQELTVTAAEARTRSLVATLEAERLEEKGEKGSHPWVMAAMEAGRRQRELVLAEARLNLHQAETDLVAAQKKSADAAAAAAKADAVKPDAAADKARKTAEEKAAKELEAAQKKSAETKKVLATAESALQSPLKPAYRSRSAENYPAQSTGRRLAFARWVADEKNPLTARVAMNHLWLRHFNRGIVPTPTDFGRGGRPPSHPQLLDWLAAEFMSQGWSMKHMHRLIVTSSTYRMTSMSGGEGARLDPDNVYLWHMPSRRLEAEAIRDNLLYVAGDLDLTMGGPDIDHALGLTSKRRSLYLRLAAEKEVEFLRIFDGPTVTECYERRPSVMPQQALALVNSDLAFRQAATLARQLESNDESDFIRKAYQRVLARTPKPAEMALCREFLAGNDTSVVVAAEEPGDSQSRGQISGGQPSSHGSANHEASEERKSKIAIEKRRQNLVLVLLNHNDFVTIR
jgi:hypothetical protein